MKMNNVKEVKNSINNKETLASKRGTLNRILKYYNEKNKEYLLSNLQDYLEVNDYKIIYKQDEGKTLVVSEIFEIEYFGFRDIEELETSEYTLTLKQENIDKEMNQYFLFENKNVNEMFVLSNILKARRFEKYQIKLRDETKFQDEFNLIIEFAEKEVDNSSLLVYVLKGINGMGDVRLSYDKKEKLVSVIADTNKINDWILGENRTLEVHDQLIYVGEESSIKFMYMFKNYIYSITANNDGSILLRNQHGNGVFYNPMNDDRFKKFVG